LSLDEALEWFWPGYRARYRARLNERFPLEQRRAFFWRTLLVFVFISGFLAWKNEHEKVANLQKQISEEGAARASLGNDYAYAYAKDGALLVGRNLSVYKLSVKKIEFEGGPAYTLLFQKEPKYLRIEPEGAVTAEIVKVGPNMHRVTCVGFDPGASAIECDFMVIMSPHNM
jgi:hypothetical protein